MQLASLLLRKSDMPDAEINLIFLRIRKVALLTQWLPGAKKCEKDGKLKNIVIGRAPS